MNIFKRLCCYILRDELAILKVHIVNQQVEFKNEITYLEAYIVNQQADLKRLKIYNKKEIEKMQAGRELYEAGNGLISSSKLNGEKANEYF